MAKAYPLLLAIVLGGVLTGGPAAAAPSGVPSLPDAVTAALLSHTPTTLAATARSRTQVTVQRRAGSGWAFGSAVLTAPAQPDAYPLGWLFLAHREAGGWRVELEGDRGFADLAGGAAVLSPAEREVFTTPSRVEYAGGDFRTGMRLPYAVGQSWSLTGGPHGWGGSETPWSSIDLAGGDGRVLAPRAGLAYTMCGSGRGWIRVVHDRGYATDYYHLFNNISANGLSVGEGAFLGNIGTDVSCGGSATGAHVHFALRQNSAYVPIADHNFGKWVIRSGGAVYQGSALHGSAQVGVGGALYNYGALGLTQGVIDANGGGAVNKRSGPGTGYAIVGSVADGATVSIACSATGTTHTGRWGTTSLWNKLTDGTWISDAFVWTGSNGTVNGTC
ncbi:MAG: peptidoglycan DD-metalloendopeptidase family protein [Hamadaea sp.]|nr:peptidoglycan DD-metalloendopeptidase family protein [Hamadaea sp.]